MFEIVMSDSMLEAGKAVIAKMAKTAGENDIMSEKFCIVPDSYSFIAERMIFDVLGIESTFSIRVITISRLLSIMGVTGCDFISSDESSLLVFKALKNLKGKLKVFSRPTVSLATELSRTISQLKACDVSAEKACEKTGSVALDMKLSDLSAVMGEYEKLLGDRLDASRAIELTLKTAPKSERIKNAEIYLLGFESMTKKNFEVVELFARLCKKVTAACAYSNGPNKHVFECDMTDKIKRLAGEMGESVKVEFVGFSGSEHQKHILSQVYAFNIKPMKNNGFCSLRQAGSKYDEVEYCGKKILSLVRAGYRFGDINLMVSDESYFPLFAQVFDQKKIPYFAEDSLTLDKTEYYNFFKNFLKIARDGLTGTSLLPLFSSDFFPLDRDLKEQLFIFYKYEAQKNAGFLAAVEKFPDFAEKLRFLQKSSEKIVKMSEVSEKLRILSEIEEFFDMKEIQKTKENRLEDKGLLKESKIFRQVPGKFSDAIKKLGEVMGDEVCDIATFFDYFAVISASKKIGSLPLSGDSVFAGCAAGGYFEERKVAIVLGAAEGNMPPVLCGSGIISDEDIEVLDKKLQIEPTTIMINRRARFRLLENLSLAKNRLIVVYSSESSGSKDLKPSAFVKDLSKMFYEDPSEICAYEWEGSICEDPCEIRAHEWEGEDPSEIRAYEWEGEDSSEIRAYEWEGSICELNDVAAKTGQSVSDSGKGSTSLTKENKSLFVGKEDKNMSPIRILPLDIVLSQNENDEILLFNTQTPQLIREIMPGFDEGSKKSLIDLQQKKFAGSLDAELLTEDIARAHELYFGDGKTKISQIETYFQCPLRHFVEYGLKARERKGLTISPIDFGNIIHRFAELCGNEIKKQKLEFTTSFKEELFEKAISGKRSQAIFSASENAVEKEALKQECFSFLDELLRESKLSSFKPVELECDVECTLNLEDKSKLEFVGIVDRVDEFDNFVRIIDYKTGTQKSSLASLYSGTELQLFIYSALVREKFQKKPCGVFYFPVSVDYKKGDGKKKAALKGYFYADEKIAKALDSRLSFDFPTSDIVEMSISTSAVNQKKNIFKINSSDHILTSEAYIKIEEYALRLITQATQEIMTGYVRPNPAASQCEVCPCSAICKREKDLAERKLGRFAIKWKDFFTFEGKTWNL